MKNKSLTNNLKFKLIAVAAMTLATPTAFASSLSANYGAATAASFDSYDLGAGAGVVALNNDGTFTGAFQTMVDGHFLGSKFVDVANLNTSFELTVTANFSGTYTTVSGIQLLSYTGGNVNLYLGIPADYNFQTDSGFNNGTKILSGAITSGSGLVSAGVGIGSEELHLSFTSYDPAVFSNQISTGVAKFNISLNDLGSLSGVSSVLGQNIGGKVLAEVDGKIQLTAVPVPAAIWTFGSGLIGLLGTTVTRKKVAT